MTVPRPDRSPEVYGIDEIFASGAVLPGFSFRMADLLSEATA